MSDTISWGDLLPPASVEPSVNPSVTEARHGASKPTKPKAESEWLNSADAARLLGINLPTMERMRTAGKIPHRRLPGCHPRYRRADLIALISEAEKGATRGRS